MRIQVAAMIGLLLSHAGWLNAQAAPSPFRWEAAAEYDYIHSNAPPSACGCFSLNGGNVSIAYRLAPHWKAVAEFGGSHTGSINNTLNDLTLLSYLVGGRYAVMPGAKVHPFAQAIFGGTHAGGRLYSSAGGFSGSTNQFTMRAGGGINVDFNSRWTLRLIEADYFLTKLPNGSNNRQNNLWLGTGLAVHFGGR